MTDRQSARAAFLSGTPSLVEQRPSEVIYQVYPASFADGNNDGHGDLKGITSKLDYIKKLGVDAIWISPFYKTPKGPEGDGGYAVSDYRAIGEQFGTMDDFKKLLKEAHDRDLRIYIDFVLAHTSHEHEWFEKSRRREPGFEDHYVWDDGYRIDRGQEKPPADLKNNPRGEVWIWDEEKQKSYQCFPRNNWKSVFGGLAWEWDEMRGQYYMHNFLKTQPQNNLNLPKVQDAILGEMKFWLDMGVDGFRFDALPFANYDPKFRNNPWRDGQWPRQHEGWGDQRFDYSMCQPQTVDLVKRIRDLADSYPNKRTTLGEGVCGPEGGGGSIATAATYVQSKTGLDMCYTDALTMCFEYPSQQFLKNKISDLLDTMPETGGNCNSIDNHDTPRSASRLLANKPEVQHPQILRQLMQLFVCLPGSFSMYQGQELGLPQARVPEDIPHNMIKDPTVASMGAAGRDGCRTPMPWISNEKNAGYSVSDTPYLPIPQSHYPLAANIQESEPDSLLNFTRTLLSWRKEQPALLQGQTRIVDNPGDIFVMLRRSEKQTMLCLFNMSDREQSFKPADHLDARFMADLKLRPDQIIAVKPFGANFHGANPVPARAPDAPAEATRPPDARVKTQTCDLG